MSDSRYLKRRRLRWTLLQLTLLATIAGLAMCTLGCFDAIPAAPNLPTGMPTLADPAAPAPSPLAAKDQELAAAVATVARLTHERDELRLAPLRTSLAWVDGIALIGMLAGVGLAVAALFWGLDFTWKIPAGAALACGGILATSLATSWALGHVAWIIASVVALAALAALWAIRKHLSLADAARTAWQLVPGDAPATHADALLDRLIGADHPPTPAKP